MAKSSTAPPLSELRTPGESESDLQILRTLDSRAEALVHGGAGLSPAAAADLVRHDIALFKQIQSNAAGDRAAEVIGEIAEAVPLYRAELARRDPSLLAAVEAATAIEQANISAKETRKALDQLPEGASHAAYLLDLGHAFAESFDSAKEPYKPTKGLDGLYRFPAVHKLGDYEPVTGTYQAADPATTVDGAYLNLGSFVHARSEALSQPERYATEVPFVDLIDEVVRDVDARRSDSPGISSWERMSSVGDAEMRSNGRNGFVEVQQDGAVVALADLAAINDWVENHDASVADKERLVSLGIKAHKAFNEPHQSELENTMEAAAQTPKAEVRRIGANMAKPDWQLAIDLLKTHAPNERAAIYIPKAGAEYGGQVLLMTDTHIVQRVGKSTAIAHDLDALQNGRELAGQMDGGQIKRGTHMKFQYGDERGNGTAIPFNQKRADEIKAEMTAWAEKAITNAKGRDTFLKHLDNATKHIAQPPARERAREPQRAPARAPQRDR
ncbi:KfrB domain-containing protein [Variovorax sp. LT1P1]|uniref:KfrB domain-containing protein n=1 Tax=Variovorax sp. LT1P1 TaxID=3443730 RepID=UPI003F47AEF9